MRYGQFCEGNCNYEYVNNSLLRDTQGTHSAPTCRLYCTNLLGTVSIPTCWVQFLFQPGGYISTNLLGTVSIPICRVQFTYLQGTYSVPTFWVISFPVIVVRCTLLIDITVSFVPSLINCVVVPIIMHLLIRLSTAVSISQSI